MNQVSDKRDNEKKTRLLTALESGMAQLHLDARRPGVIVPDQFKGDFHLRLNHSYRFDPPDLSINEWGVRQTLSFGGSRFTVGIPWSAIYAVAALTTEELWMFPDDMPLELVQAATEKAKLPVEPPPEGEVTPRAVLREVVASAPQEEPPQEPTPPKRGHLRLVK